MRAVPHASPVCGLVLKLASGLASDLGRGTLVKRGRPQGRLLADMQLIDIGRLERSHR